MRNVLVAMQISCPVVLLVGAGLYVRNMPVPGGKLCGLPPHQAC